MHSFSRGTHKIVCGERNVIQHFHQQLFPDQQCGVGIPIHPEFFTEKKNKKTIHGQHRKATVAIIKAIGLCWPHLLWPGCSLKTAQHSGCNPRTFSALMRQLCRVRPGRTFTWENRNTHCQHRDDNRGTTHGAVSNHGVRNQHSLNNTLARGLYRRYLGR